MNTTTTYKAMQINETEDGFKIQNFPTIPYKTLSAAKAAITKYINSKHFILLEDDTITQDGITLYRIQATKDIPIHGVKTGDIGGYVQYYHNLYDNAWVSGDAWVSGNAKVSGKARVSSNAKVSGNAWVSDNARVLDNARVFNNAQVYGNACVSDNARVFNNAQVSDNVCVSGNARVFNNAQVYGNACVSDNVCVFNNAQVYGNACVSGDVCVFNNARVFNNAQVYGNAHISGDAKVYGNPLIKSDSDFLITPPALSSGRCTIAYRTNDNEIEIRTGCFYGNLTQFKEQIYKTHSNNKDYLEQYLSFCDMISTHFNLA